MEWLCCALLEYCLCPDYRVSVQVKLCVSWTSRLRVKATEVSLSLNMILSMILGFINCVIWSMFLFTNDISGVISCMLCFVIQCYEIKDRLGIMFFVESIFEGVICVVYEISICKSFFTLANAMLALLLFTLDWSTWKWFAVSDLFISY